LAQPSPRCCGGEIYKPTNLNRETPATVWESRELLEIVGIHRVSSTAYELQIDAKICSECLTPQ
jgi:hypothetical protein